MQRVLHAVDLAMVLSRPFKRKQESERRAFLPLGFADYLSVKLAHDLAANVQAEANSFRSDLFCLMEEAEQLEKLVHILLFDPDALVFDLDLEHSVLRPVDYVSKNWDVLHSQLLGTVDQLY